MDDSDEISKRLELIEMYIHGLFNAVAALAHELTGKQIVVILTDADGSNARKWVPNGRTAIWRAAPVPFSPVDLSSSPAMPPGHQTGLDANDP